MGACTHGIELVKKIKFLDLGSILKVRSGGFGMQEER